MSINAEISKLEKSRVRLDIVVENTEVREAFDRTYQKIAKNAHIKGFRPGKAPVGVIRMKYGTSIAQEVLEQLIKEAYDKAVLQHKLQPLGGGSVTSELSGLKEEDTLTFSIEVDVYPECVLPGYMGVPVTVDRYEVSQSDVDAELARITESHTAILDKPEGVLEADDLALVDYEVLLDGAPVQKLTRKGYSYDLKTGASYPDFQNALCGLTTGGSFEIPGRVPEGFPDPDLAGKDVIFKGEIAAMQRRKPPVVNDEFAASISDKKTVAEFRDLLFERMQEHAREFVSAAARQKILGILCAKFEAVLPESLVENQVRSALESFEQRMRRTSGSADSLEDLIERAGGSIEAMCKELRPEAEKSAREYILIREIAKKENIEPDEAEIDEALEGFAHYYGLDRETLRNRFIQSDEMSSLVWRLTFRKTLEFLEKAATIQTGNTLPFAEMKE
ncbi:MAG: trigger factor [Spirochaetota bacterium]|nr:trigger factor [Spirochaetota bacterium]